MNKRDEIHEINGIRFCCSEEFLISKGCDGARVYVGLGIDGSQKLADLYSNSQSILHRDIKLQNILQDIHGNWLLADFGLSRLLCREASTYASSQKGINEWRAFESYPSNETSDDKVRYKKESDIQVGVCY